MKIAVCTLESTSPYSQSRHYSEPAKLNKESPKDYEARTWRERCHVDKKGNIIIPPMAFKNCLYEATAFNSKKIQGKGQETWTKHFLAGILVTTGVTLPITKEKVKGEWLFVPSDGKRGGGKRVDKCFPIIEEWTGEVTYYVADDTITKDIFEEYLREAGMFIGIGRFRMRNGGFYGGFKVKSVKWQE